MSDYHDNWKPGDELERLSEALAASKEREAGLRAELAEKDKRIEGIENIAASSGKANVRLMNKIDCLNKCIEELGGARIRALEGGDAYGKGIEYIESPRQQLKDKRSESNILRADIERLREALELLSESNILRAENERLRLALDAIVHYSRQPNSMGAIASDYAAELRGVRDIARRALEGGE